MKRLRFDSVFRVRVGPFDRGCRLIVMADISQKFPAEIGYRREDAAGDDMALNFGKPVFHLIEPGGISRSKMHADIGVSVQKGVHQLRLVGRKIVNDDVNLFTRRLRGYDLIEETHELRAGMALGGLAKDFSALSLQSGIERKRPVAKVFKTMRFGSPGGKRKDGVKTIQSLDGALFIDTKDRCVGRRVQIEADDVRRLGFKVRVIADHVVSQAMRLQPVAAPNSGYRHVGRTQLLGQASAAPLRGAVIRATPGPLQDASLQLGRAIGRRAALMPGNQASQALRTKPSGPPLDIRGAASQVGGCLAQASPTRQFQNDSCPSGILCPNTPRSHPPLKFHAFRWSKDQAFGGHPSKLPASVANINVTMH